MAYDETLAARVRDALRAEPGLSEKKMFGGLCFLLHGHMACGIVKDELMLRVGPARYEETLALQHARPMDFTGKAMKGMVYVSRGGLGDEPALRGWVERARAFVRTLPPK
jgi:TfoX/Sxy family transcriptional regulator of competence genes